MKIELQNGKTVATAESVDDVRALLSLGNGEVTRYGKPRKIHFIHFTKKECTYCHKVFARLGKHTPACKIRTKRMAEYHKGRETVSV